jgi:hypothetical protein
VEGYSVSRIAAHGVDLVSAGGTRHLPMRPLHELPPPVAPGVDPLQKRAAGSRDSDELTQSFWATFDSN